jgi:ATP-dependent helicase/nuclease subunit A
MSAKRTEIPIDPLASFELTPDQHQAATELARDVLLTAGAGTGKTRTLVARYVHLLSEGFDERRMVAITFTEKAAREMRNRIRQSVSELAAESQGSAQARWLEVEARMDAARIGTIHSLCAEILRAHPAEAQIDPGFVVVDEGLSLAYKAQAVTDALAWAAGDPEAAELFRAFSTTRLSSVVARLLDRRLEAEALLDGGDASVGDRLRVELKAFLSLEPVIEGVAILRALADSGELAADAGPSLGPVAERLLEFWAALEAALAADDLLAASAALYQVRREGLKKIGGGAESQARAVIHELQALYDERLDPWLGGAKSGSAPPSAEADAVWDEQRPRLETLFGRARVAYRRSLDARRALDFDDLEAGALALLERPEIGDRWRERLGAVLVDEFQDTNDRQRRIIDELAGARPGALFAVGDARQSIYCFRGADVRVFRRKRREVEQSGGLAPEIELSFRAHAPLLAALDDFVGPLMGREQDGSLHRVPYTSLTADRADPETSGAGPHLEVVLGAGEGAELARAAAAQVLADRLVELRRDGVIRDWGQVALLFRASSGFEAYETALETSGIPFVTVAGRGFYDRPEIRDLLNSLHAIADPSDDLALAGFLRSPAVGLSDAALFRLRVNGSELRPLQAALSGAHELLDGQELARAERAQMLLDELHPLADRLPVAELISRLVGRLDWRAVLASAHARLWRNLDKLVDDAQASELVHVSAFLEYLKTLRDAGAREGEAQAAEGGALQLMTIHKAKGLEFDLIVLADASRSGPQRSQPAYLVEEVGVAAAPDRVEGEPMAYRLAKVLDSEQVQAEEDRLLYVAATRARERLIVSGHLSQTQRGTGVSGWMKATLDLLDLKPADLVANPGEVQELRLPGKQRLRLWVGADSDPLRLDPSGTPAAWPDSDEPPLFQRAEAPPKEVADPELDQEPERSWRATGTGRRAPATAVGRIVHAAIHRSSLPGSTGYPRFMENEAFRSGLVDPRQREAAIQESTEMLERLMAHTLWGEIEVAEELYREIPFTTIGSGGEVQSGQIDMLWHGPDGWQIVDFKTDTLRDEADVIAATDRHRNQVERYVRAAGNIIGETPRGMLCFLDSSGRVELVEI